MKLPDPLVFEDGRRVTTRAEWRARRKELLALFSTHVYGRSPPAPDAIDVEIQDRKLHLTCRRGDLSSSFEIHRFGPAQRSPCFLFLNNREPILIAGLKEAGFHMRLADGLPLPPSR